MAQTSVDVDLFAALAMSSNQNDHDHRAEDRDGSRHPNESQPHQREQAPVQVMVPHVSRPFNQNDVFSFLQIKLLEEILALRQDVRTIARQLNVDLNQAPEQAQDIRDRSRSPAARLP